MDHLLRRVTSTVELDVTDPADLVLSVAAAGTPDEERLEVTLDGARLDDVVELEAPEATRLHRVRSPRGRLVVSYSATVGAGAAADPVGPVDEIVYTRPSRYCDSDRLAAVAAHHFEGLAGHDLVRAVEEFVHEQIAYTPGVSDVVDGALEAYLRRAGVCRDLAQLVVTFLRARGLPARLVSVYAPGLSPMDFHAVAEVALDGRWWVVDATRLAPRASLVRIATGRDAADTAFLTISSGRADLASMGVTAVVDPDLPVDDPAALVALG